MNIELSKVPDLVCYANFPVYLSDKILAQATIKRRKHNIHPDHEHYKKEK